MLRQLHLYSPMKQSRIQSALLLFVVAVSLFWWQRTPAFTDACLLSDNDVVICAASNMARYGRTDPLVLEHSDFDLRASSNESSSSSSSETSSSGATIKLSAARNESVGFQLIFRTIGKAAPANVSVNLGPWQLTKNAPDTKDAPYTPLIQSRLLQAHYHLVEKGGYTWGPKSAVRAWPAEYPDALVPQQHGCLGQSVPVFDAIALPTQKNQNQAVWIDSYVPTALEPGTYTMPIKVKLAEQSIPLSIELTVFDVTLPDKTSIDAIGEVYRSYALEGAGTSRDSESWQRMAQCYQQVAHQHRMVFIERTPKLPDADGWRTYADTYQSTFDGTLFSEQFGYHGTGENTPVEIWRVPWPQEFNVKLEAPLSDDDFARYTKMSQQWNALRQKYNWQDTTFFAYVFDEVDGPDKQNTDLTERRNYIVMVHDQMDLLQKALDAGTGDESLDLLWTSHSNPASWSSDPQLDLSDKVRLWSPNASAADPEFLRERVQAGDTTWFYHSGHPAVGAHSINASGIDMRTWGVIGARYDIQGQFMWAVNLGSDERPFAEPSYKPDDDRFGNGVMVYPGNQLDKLGFEKVPGPIPSMRLKSWRRGLQDAELFLLAKDKNSDMANKLIRTIMPDALADAEGKASWSQEPAAWIDFKKNLLIMAAE